MPIENSGRLSASNQFNAGVKVELVFTTHK